MILRRASRVPTPSDNRAAVSCGDLEAFRVEEGLGEGARDGGERKNGDSLAVEEGKSSLLP